MREALFFLSGAITTGAMLVGAAILLLTCATTVAPGQVPAQFRRAFAACVGVLAIGLAMLAGAVLTPP